MEQTRFHPALRGQCDAVNVGIAVRVGVYGWALSTRRGHQSIAEHEKGVLLYLAVDFVSS